MRPTLFLRFASILTFVHAVMHTVGGVFGKPAPGVAAMVAETMRANRFAVFGVTRSYTDFYRGLGLGVTIALIVEAVLLWQMGTLARKDGWALRPMMATMMLGFLFFAVNSHLYFFYGPMVAEVLI